MCSSSVYIYIYCCNCICPYLPLHVHVCMCMHMCVCMWECFLLVLLFILYSSIAVSLLLLPPPSPPCSISVNVWTDPVQASVVADMFSSPVPYEHITDRRLKTASAAFLIHKVLKGVCRKKKCSTPEEDPFYVSDEDSDDALSEAVHRDLALYLVHRLWSVRYKHIMDSKMIPSSLPKGFSCRNTPFTAQDISEAMTSAHVKTFVSTVTKLAAELPTDTWELWLGNYIEYLASLAVNVDKVGAFLKDLEHCLL